MSLKISVYSSSRSRDSSTPVTQPLVTKATTSDEQECTTFGASNSNHRRAFFKSAMTLLPLPVAASKVSATSTGSLTTEAPFTTTTPLPLSPLPPSPLLAPLPSKVENTDLTLLLPQFQTVNDVPDDYFTNQKYIYAFVERIIDGDTMRVRHVPGFALQRQVPEPLQTRGIANATLSVRVYGVDTPEIGKNKRQTSQAFAEEAKQFTTDLVYHKMVKITFLKKDQYNRAVACIETVPSLLTTFIPGAGNKDLSIELAREGLAELYTGGGAVYYNRKAELEAAIQDAQRLKKGQWSLSPEERQSAAAKKREMREQQRLEAAGAIPVATRTRGGNVLESAMTGLELAA
jgi:endonuclease YncB( thermonuclease family)